MATSWTTIATGDNIKTSHQQEIRTGLNSELTRRSLSTLATNTDYTTGATIKKEHIQSVRDIINNFSTVTFTDPTLSNTVNIKKVHIDELRLKINNLENKPKQDQAVSDCNSSCTGLCVGCSGTCYNGCTGTCNTGCYNTCKDTCSTCASSCSDGCSGCGSGCASTCSSCGAGCATSCTNACTGCYAGCEGSSVRYNMAGGCDQNNPDHDAQSDVTGAFGYEAWCSTIVTNVYGQYGGSNVSVKLTWGDGFPSERSIFATGGTSSGRYPLRSELADRSNGNLWHDVSWMYPTAVLGISWTAYIQMPSRYY